MAKIEPTAESTFEHWFAVAMYRDTFQLSYILLTTNSIMFYYFLGRHILARYVKLRCCIDFNLPQKEAFTEFAAHETKRPFEHIIRRFLLRKLHL